MTDWAEWSRDAVAAMKAQNEACLCGDARPAAAYRPEWPGSRADGLEMLAIAGRLQDASGGFIDSAGELTLSSG